MAAAAAPPDGDAKSKLSQPDSIMAADVAASIAKYMKESGSVGELIQMLCTNYHGYAQMSNLMESWLVMAGESEDEIRAVAQEHVRSTILSSYDDERATAAFFSADKGVVSRWVAEMIRHSEWRRLIYDLSDEYPNSLMLSYIIKQIAVAGFQREIAEIKSVSNHLDVFSAVLSDWIAEAIREDEDGLQGVLKKITAMACTSQHAYVFSQALLHSMMDGPLEGAMRRISEEMHHTCESKVVAGQIEFQLNGAISGPEATDAVVSIVDSGRTGHSLRILHELYSSATPPPVEILRFPGLLDVLVDEVFVPDFDPTRVADIDRYAYVLAYAVSANDASGYPAELDSTIQAIKEVLEKLHTGILTGAGSTVLFEYLPYPIVAGGALRWLEVVVGSPDFFATYVDHAALPPHFALLDEVCAIHPMLRDQVLELLLGFIGQTYAVDTLAAVGLKRKLLDRVLYLFASGHATQVLRRLSREKLDTTLLVHFLNQVLRHIAPPYSVKFFMQLADFFRRPPVAAAYSAKVAERAAVITFLEAGLHDLQSELTHDEVHDAQDLRTAYAKA
mmetsp:Transcript_35245/g.92212  ORF Transcript_35245/g.92212 Transcript_35245/m.92212 type:complete len:561 (+) Transcript_35245:264-1946(+)|eukprot:CAMPEP_0182921404 /NCGR_PEP_ID=MMETSP0105_2-20130417/4124_1 /TAXON_ID=81532 ORGANISM="Acanthoeca-like sp., Strain 10tr" /NCGR_SAMPLE_ID=MMETSP0105_2 /ASSEMBLY_ACC=CAM_ASM_000205 /LENGTH=560 /DNA_ID=CAMNT_0025058923 /DNA_START=219 /DNA_END=1901 /DNA_ORIENTATION=+